MAALLVPALVLFGAFVLIGFAQVLNTVGRSEAETSSGFWQTVLPFLTGEAYVKAFVKGMRGPVSRWALAQLAPVARWIAALNSLVVAHSATTARMEDAIGDGFTRLTAVVIPRIAAQKANPALKKATTATKAADHAASRAKTANTAVTHLGAEVRPKIKAHQHAIDVTLPGEIGRIRTREKEIGKEIEHPNHSLLKRWAGWLWSAGLGATLIRAIAKKFPWLFCRKTATIGKRLCGLDDSLLQGFLDATILLASTVSVVEFVKDAQAIEEVAIDALRGLVRELDRAAEEAKKIAQQGA